jgi:hypothetical protein
MIKVRKIDGKTIGIMDDSQSSREGFFTASFMASGSGEMVRLSSDVYPISFYGTYDAFEIEGEVTESAEAAIVALNTFAGDFTTSLANVSFEDEAGEI